jgi:hypothetical protein
MNLEDLKMMALGGLFVIPVWFIYCAGVILLG